MPKPRRKPKPRAWTANQVVAYNLRRARRGRGLSQAEAAKQLAPFLGQEWSTASFSAAETPGDPRSTTDRIRQFTADDILAFSRAFNLPILYFFLPPAMDDVQEFAVTSAKEAKEPPLDANELAEKPILSAIGIGERLVDAGTLASKEVDEALRRRLARLTASMVRRFLNLKAEIRRMERLTEFFRKLEKDIIVSELTADETGEEDGLDQQST